MKQKILLIIGLPGSGKSTYIEQHQNVFNDFVICDDYHKSALQKSRAFKDSVYYADVRNALILGKSVVMADIAWCKSERLDMVISGLRGLLKELKINPLLEFLYFENNPEVCKRNAIHRGRKERIDRELEFIDEISKQYRIPNDIVPIKIVNAREGSK